MMKIAKSLAMIAFVAAIGVYATSSYFSDTEISTGNKFTAGAIDLTVDSEQHYNGNKCVKYTGSTTDPINPALDYVWEGTALYPPSGTPCDGTWEKTDLGIAHKFFNYSDVKPGDEGENTISLHIDSNDAYACADIYITKNDDMSCTESELEADPTCVDPGTDSDGELAQNIYFTAWVDDGNNVLDDGEVLLFTNVSGPASDVLTGESYMLAGPGFPLIGGNTTYIGLAWCAGKMVVTPISAIDPDTGLSSATAATKILCDGAEMRNDCQTDSMEATISFRVEQARHNDEFVCELPV